MGQADPSPRIGAPKARPEPVFEGPNGADRLVHYLFRDIAGFYVDVAQGGEHLDTRVLDSLGWQGVCLSSELLDGASLDDVLDQEVPGRRVVEFLSLDTGGTEAPVLESLDLDRHAVVTLLVAARN